MLRHGDFRFSAPTQETSDERAAHEFAPRRLCLGMHCIGMSKYLLLLLLLLYLMPRHISHKLYKFVSCIFSLVTHTILYSK